ncbi:MAG: PfaD family polyunsaturated fatty acid/polyketide biosynthesis protein [Acidobacteriaceae bacterium]|nr:PfaD family polyunsaturated fatty acid/polyketide biosynthesis protein [Acidobacteriaceae bacterium]MBV9038450.1 PfaD family polyunsaturated fatty acid/polyketide biosynthesis protein [Acidobacteriaceae bacterium]MBV9224285.1 PfaD family polyunsaturated fatty acid/polyketide biosynthesis protein [Acidobacteriaceae bacterium]MBV9304555.1 PfaD family polyunsaturated fatty acid/polyketide biosynthesis protein [Acidobacteriaceae bacterium]
MILSGCAITPTSLGSGEFCQAHNVRYAYVAGAMYQGIASPALVSRMARARLLSYLGTGGLPLSRIEKDISGLRNDLPRDLPFGANLLHHPDDPAFEQATVNIYLKHHLDHIEAAAFIEITPALAAFRLSGLRRNGVGRIEGSRHVMAKVSRPEIAKRFLSPPSPELLANLRDTGMLTAEQAEWATQVPLADDVCVEADSGGHTDQGVAYALLPAILALRDEVARTHVSAAQVKIGTAGGLGTPPAIAAAFVMGADFVLTGSINQCTVEAGTSDRVKNLLQNARPQDTAIVPAGDMLEIGAKMQVFRRGLLFPARAVRLYELYRDFSSWHAIPPEIRQQIESRYFRCSFEQVVNELQAYYTNQSPERWRATQENPRQLLGLVFRWYFHYTTQWALEGHPDREVDYQIHCGPALGSFNAWIQGTKFTDWRSRHVDHIAEYLMTSAAEFLSQRLGSLCR